MKKYSIYLFCIATTLTGCNFLDKEPDLRADIDTQKKVQLLLVSGYDMPNISAVGEMMSDNTIDNNTPDEQGKTYTKEPMSQMYNQYFAFEDITSSSQQDSPYNIWQGCYHNIAVANQAINAINEIEAKDGSKLNAERAEALLIRAYNHFILVNVFCQAYKDDVTSKQDSGVHYMTAAETTVRPSYDRSNVADVYKNIEKDLRDALETYGVDDGYFSVPKYHFNKSAAYAFAARFYLFKRNYDKTIEYANKVLGSNPAGMMWDAASAKKLGNAENERDAWYDATSPANLMISACLSTYYYSAIPSYCRYTLNREAKDNTINGAGPNWDGRWPGVNIWQYDENFGGFEAKFSGYFEYTDKVAGIGYPRMLRREFTSGETLLCRAEAQIMKGNLSAALSDMQIWTKAYLATKDLTDDNIREFFHSSKTNRQVVPILHCKDMCSSWTVSDNALPYVLCVLHFRRLENMHDGTRFFDLKRYGIEITHLIGAEKKEYKLTWNDDRRAVQLPQEAIIAGQSANKRVIKGDNNGLVTGNVTEVNPMTLGAFNTTQPTLAPTDKLLK